LVFCFHSISFLQHNSGPTIYFTSSDYGLIITPQPHTDIFLVTNDALVIEIGAVAAQS